MAAAAVIAAATAAAACEPFSGGQALSFYPFRAQTNWRRRYLSVDAPKSVFDMPP